MKMNKMITIISSIVIVSSSLMAYNTYAKNDNKLAVALSTMNEDNSLSEIESCLEEFKGDKIQLNPGSSSSSMTKLNSLEMEELNSIEIPEIDLEDEAEARKKKGLRFDKVDEAEDAKKMVTLADTPSALPTLSKYDMDEVKKVFRYNDKLMEKIKEGSSLSDEAFYWQIPIINTIGENGTVYLENSQRGNGLDIKAIEFPIDNRMMFLNNDEIIELVENTFENDDVVKNVYFLDLPISSTGTVVAAIEMESGDTVFATVQDVEYSNGMEFKKVYSYDTMLNFINDFNDKLSE